MRNRSLRILISLSLSLCMILSCAGLALAEETVAGDENTEQPIVETEQEYQIGEVIFSKTQFVYDGTEKNPVLTVTDAQGEALTEGVDYTVTVPDGRTKVGLYTYEITYIGNYEGTAEVSFTINPKKPAIKSFTARLNRLIVKMEYAPSSTSGTTYEIAYKRKGTVTWKYTTTNTRSKTIRGLLNGKRYYVKVRAYKMVGEDKIAGSWSASKLSPVVKMPSRPTMTLVKSGSGRFDIRKAAGQAQYKYDTVQGACAYDGYAYFALYNRNVERVKIAKVNLSTMKVVKVSTPLSVRCHADTLTYNPKTNRIIAGCGKGGRKRIAIIDATTLKVVSTKTFNLSRSLIGGYYQGVSGISYNEAKDIYTLKIRGPENKVVKLDNKFKVIKRVKIEGNKSYLLAQGIHTYGKYMYDVQSFKGKHKYNLVTVRTLGGKLVGRLTIPSGTKGQLYELENIFNDGDDWYISFYRANVKKSGDTDRKNYLYKISF